MSRRTIGEVREEVVYQRTNEIEIPVRRHFAVSRRGVK